MLLVAGIINAIGVTLFIAPVQLYDSGISGTSILLSQLTPDYLSLSFFLVLLNVPLLLFGFKRQGAVFSVYAIFAVCVYSAAAWLITDVLPIDVSIASPLAGTDLFLCALFGGIISGVGSGLAIRYGGAMCYFYVTVENKEAVVDGIGVVTLPKKTQYKVGDNLETEGLSIRAYSGNTHFDIFSGLDCSPTVLNTAGSQTITVTYAGKTCTFTVKVAEEKEVIQTVTVAARPTKVEYTVGDRLDSTGLTLRVVTNKGTSEITSGFTCTPKVLTAAGTQTVTVVYGQYTCTFDVTVKAASSPSPSPTPTPSPSASPAVSASPSAGPGAVSPSPSASRHDNGSNSVSAVVKVGLIVAVLALAGLAGCVYVLQKKGNVDFLSMFTGKNKQDRGRH